MHARNDQDESNAAAEGPSNNDEIQSIMSQSQSNDAPIASYGSSNSNNVLTSIQSGSMKRFNRLPRHTDDSDDDEVNDGNRYHDCNEPNQTVFAPISTSQPAFNPYDYASTSASQAHARSDDAANPPYQRIAVAALPNLEFDQFTMSRGFSASSPSLYSQPESTSRRNSNESDPRRKNFARNTTASSSNYFM